MNVWLAPRVTLCWILSLALLLVLPPPLLEKKESGMPAKTNLHCSAMPLGMLLAEGHPVEP